MSSNVVFTSPSLPTYRTNTDSCLIILQSVLPSAKTEKKLELLMSFCVSFLSESAIAAMNDSHAFAFLKCLPIFSPFFFLQVKRNSKLCHGQVFFCKQMCCVEKFLQFLLRLLVDFTAYSLQQRLFWFFFGFSLLKTKVMRVTLLVTHKRITAKTSCGRSIDADIKQARFIGYCQILVAHNAEDFFLLLIKFNPGKFFPCWLEFSNLTFYILFLFLIVRMFLFAGVRFSFTTSFPQVRQISRHLVH